MHMKPSCAIMAGGKGSRLGNPFKPLVEICGMPLIKRVYEALSSSGICKDKIIVASSSRLESRLSILLPKTRILILENGYVRDLKQLLEEAGTPLLVYPADIPFLNQWHVKTHYTIGVLLGKAYRAHVINLLGPEGPTGASLHLSLEPGPWIDLEINDKLLFDIDNTKELRKALETCQ